MRDPTLKLKERGDNKTCPAAIIIRNGKVLTGLRHYKSGSLWTVPGGRCDEGETLEEALRREVIEEVGLVHLEIQTYIGEIAGSKQGDRVHLFLCASSEEPELKEPEKFSEWKWLRLEDIPENFINIQTLELIKKTVVNSRGKSI